MKKKIRYEIVEHKSKELYGCGGMAGHAFEIKFFLNDEDRYLFVYSDDLSGALMLLDYSAYDAVEAELNGVDGIEYGDPLELWESIEEAEDSEYYDLYAEMEKYVDEQEP